MEAGVRRTVRTRRPFAHLKSLTCSPEPSPLVGSRTHRGNWKRSVVELRCPKCSGADVRSFSLVYKAGTASVVAHTHAAGAGLSGDGPVVAAGSAYTAGRQQTLLSEQCAPPEQQPVGCAQVAMVGGGIIAVVGFFGEGLEEGARVLLSLIGLASLLLGFFLYRTASIFNSKEHPKVLAKWKQSFLCLRCGEVFVPNA